jgi:hypothetical protein
MQFVSRIGFHLGTQLRWGEASVALAALMFTVAALRRLRAPGIFADTIGTAAQTCSCGSRVITRPIFRLRFSQSLPLFVAIQSCSG